MACERSILEVMFEMLKNFLDEKGRLRAFPAKRKLKLVALEFLARNFEKDKVYSEKEVNELLNKRHTFCDPATLRRELVEAGFLTRTADCREYRLNDPPTNTDVALN